jgi:hypothetical protein
MNKIPDSHLVEKDVLSGSASWNDIEPFALTFDGYSHWGSFKQCREAARQDLYTGKKKWDGFGANTMHSL